jgi:class 3 adenylate cyclase
MTPEPEDKALIRRVAKLVKQNQDISEQYEKLQKEYEKLLSDNGRMQQMLAELTDSQKARLNELEERPETLKFKMVTVLFAEVHGLRKVAEGLNSQILMDEMDTIYFEFDTIVKKYRIEKIKTIGDTYMCAGGIPLKNITNPVDVVMASLEMMRYINDLQKNREEKIWELRVGIHTGPVTASTIGQKKISYDIKGDTVNIASRMETFGEFGKITMSVMTYELVKEFFNCEYFGKLPVKYKNDLEFFSVKGLKPEFSEDTEGQIPNHNFDVKYKLIQFTDLQEIILDRLERELPKNLYYHNVKHTVDVVTEVELIGWAESVSDEEIVLLKTAALFHDAGHTISYKDHEDRGCEIARDFLPKYSYNKAQIDRICEIIMATKLPPTPKNLLEEIICDSDLDYLGRIDFIPVSNTLYQELSDRNMIGTLNEWNKLQVKFISKHNYFTNTARTLREVNKQKQIERISAIIVEE